MSGTEENSETARLLGTQELELPSVSATGAGVETISSSSMNQNARRRQMNRSRRNIPMFQADILWGIEKVEKIFKEREFNLAQYQLDLTQGTPEEARQAKKELKIILYILNELRNIQSNTSKKYINKYPLDIKDRLVTLVALQYSNTPLLMAIMAAETVGTGGVLTLPLLTGILFSVLGILVSAKVKKIMVSGNARMLHKYIQKILDDDAKVAVNKRMYRMKNNNIVSRNSWMQLVNPMFINSNTDEIKEYKPTFNTNTSNFNTNRSRRKPIKKNFSPVKPSYTLRKTRKH